MKYLQKTTNFFRNEFIGYTFVFEDDTEITLDDCGELIDYSGMGFERSERYAAKLR